MHNDDVATWNKASEQNLYFRLNSRTVAYLSDVYAGMTVAFDSVLHEKAFLLVLMITILQSNHPRVRV